MSALRIFAVLLPMMALTAFAQGLELDAKRLNEIRFADQYPGSSAGQRIQAALADLPAGGGVVDARNLRRRFYPDGSGNAVAGKVVWGHFTGHPISAVPASAAAVSGNAESPL